MRKAKKTGNLKDEVEQLKAEVDRLSITFTMPDNTKERLTQEQCRDAALAALYFDTPSSEVETMLDAKEASDDSRMCELLSMVFDNGVVDAMPAREDFAPVLERGLPIENRPKLAFEV
jgi:hypothetical protein